VLSAQYSRVINVVPVNRVLTIEGRLFRVYFTESMLCAMLFFFLEFY